MGKGPPKLVAVGHDDYHAEYVGRTRDGRQFFLTTPFVPGEREFIALENLKSFRRDYAKHATSWLSGNGGAPREKAAYDHSSLLVRRRVELPASAVAEEVVGS